MDENQGQRLTKKQRRELKKQKKAEEQRKQAIRTRVIRISVWSVGILVVLGAWYLGFKNAGNDGSNTNADTPAAAVEGNPTLGNPDAPIVITEYSDFSCPYCARGAETAKQLVEDYGDNVLLAFNGFDLDHKQSQSSLESGECAYDQGKFWEMHDLLFSNQSDWVNEDDVTDIFVGYAEEAGLDTERFRTCLENEEKKDAVADDTRVARQAEVNSTPTFHINGQVVKGAQPLEEFKKVIDAELEAAGVSMEEDGTMEADDGSDETATEDTDEAGEDSSEVPEEGTTEEATE